MNDIELEPYLLSIYELLKAQHRKFGDAQYYLGTSRDYLEGVEKFRKERKSSINLLREFIGIREAEEFSSLPSVFLKAHPSMLKDYTYKEFARDEIESHKNFLKVFITGLKDGSVKLNGTEIKKKREEVLRAFYEVKINGKAFMSKEDYQNIGHIDFNEQMFILDYLKKNRLIEEVELEFSISSLGIKEIEMINKAEQETPEQKRFRILKAVYDLAEGSPTELVFYEVLEEATKTEYRKIEGILRYLEQRYLIKTTENWVEITSAGIDEIETIRKHPEKPTQYFPSNIYNTTIIGSVTGLQQGGQNNTQNNTQNINPDFTKAIDDLLTAIENSSLDRLQKINAKSDVQLIKDLADLEKSPEVLRLASSKIEAVKEVLSMTADMTSLGMIVIPILQAAFGS